MSRRKQAKPQHLHSDQPEADNGLLHPLSPGGLQDGQVDENSGERKRLRLEEMRVCNKCCAEYFDEAEFLKHQKNCTKSQQVVIMKNGDGNGVPEDGLEDTSGDSSSDGPHSDHDNGRPSSNSLSNVKAESPELSDEEGSKSMELEESSKRGHTSSTSPDMNYQPSPKLQDSNVTLSSMAATRVAVTQHSSSRPPTPSEEMLAAIPLILEQLVSLQQQQLHQIQLTEQIRIQVAMMAPAGVHSAVGAAVDPLKALGAHLSQQLSAAAALIGKRTGSQSLTIETMKQGKLPQPPRIPTMPSKSDPWKGLPELASQLALHPQLPGAPASPSSFPGLPAAVDPSKKLKSKIPNMLYETKTVSGDHMYKHKCKYCGKSFGNDSALQIHLRSHTGERPFKCNICGNRFTTKGNLKVHFQRHKEKYPHVRMNPHPVPEHLDNMPTSSGIPYGMSMPIEESNMVDVKPPIGILAPGFHPSPMQGFKASFEGFGSNPFAQRPLASGNDGTSMSSALFGHEAGSDQNDDSKDLMGALQHMNGHHPLGEHSSGTAKLQQMVDGLEKRTGDPNECVICHRVLSCQSSLKMHYRTHTGERPYKCKICGRAFSTKGNLKAHYGVHRANTPLKMQHSCPICQKKFTNAVVLQQHIRMHMGGQIPNTPVAESEYDATEAMDSSLPEEKLIDVNSFNDSMDDEDTEPDAKKKPIGAPSEPLSQSASKEQQLPAPHSMFSGIAALENHMKNLTSALNLQRQSSTASESEGATRGSPSAPKEQEYQNGRSPAVSDSASFRSSSSPVNSYMGSIRSKSPEVNGYMGSSRPKSPEANSYLGNDHSKSPEVNNYLGNSRSKSPEVGLPEDFSQKGVRLESDSGSQEPDESSGALDLTAPSSFIPKPIKEEPGLPFSNGDYAASHMPFMRMIPSLTGMEIQVPSENPLGAHGLFGSQMPHAAGFPSSVSSAPRRSTKQHLCNACGKNFSSASALQIHERTHTGEKPFACTICGRAFTTKGNLKVHVGTHMWNNSSRRGQRLSLDNPMALMAMGAEANMIPDMMPPPKELGPPPMNFDTSMWNQYAAAITNGLSMKTNEISVIQNGGIPLPGSLAAGPLVGSTGGLMKMDTSHSGLPSSMGEMEKTVSESVPRSQFPHFMEEGKIAVK